jgi:hypothetical protein
MMKTGFGWIEINGIRYDHDIIIHTDGSVSKRPKKRSRALKAEYGHTPLSDEELGSVLDEHPDTVYIGTGQYGSLPVTPKALALLVPYKPVLMPTPDLLSILENEMRRYLAVMHVTC